jgi:hypothetical protein
VKQSSVPPFWMASGFAFAMTRAVISFFDKRSLLETYIDDEYNHIKINAIPLGIIAR